MLFKELAVVEVEAPLVSFRLYQILEAFDECGFAEGIEVELSMSPSLFLRWKVVSGRIVVVYVWVVGKIR